MPPFMFDKQSVTICLTIHSETQKKSSSLHAQSHPSKASSRHQCHRRYAPNSTAHKSVMQIILTYLIRAAPPRNRPVPLPPFTNCERAVCYAYPAFDGAIEASPVHVDAAAANDDDDEADCAGRPAACEPWIPEVFAAQCAEEQVAHSIWICIATIYIYIYIYIKNCMYVCIW
jgi:hypothetical protein